MKKYKSKLLSLVLAVALIVAALPIAIPSTAAAAVDVSNCTNLLAGKTPINFGQTTKDTLPNSWQWAALTVGGTGLETTSSYIGYWSSAPTHKENLLPYLALLTDENNTNTFNYSSTNASSYDLCMMYDLGAEYDIQAIEVLSGAWKSDVDVYVSHTTDGLFSTDNYVASFTRNNSADVTDQLQSVEKKNVRYVGFWLDYNDAYTSLFELRVYEKYVEPFNPSDYDNALSGKTPINFGQTTKDTLPNSWQWAALTVGGTGLETTSSYIGYWGSAPTHKENLLPYLALLTDENNTNTFNYSSTNASSYDLCMMYDLGEEKDIRAIEVLSGAWKSDVDIYVSSTTDGLFSEANYVGSFTRNNSTDVTDQLQRIEKDSIRYVGFWLDYNDAYTSLSELRVYTEKPFVRENYDNALSGKTPINFGQTTKDTLPNSWQWAALTVGGTGLETTSSYIGYWSSAPTHKENLLPYLALLTDENNTNTFNYSSTNASAYDLCMMYDLGEEKDIRAIEVLSGAWKSDVDIYVSSTTDGLFSEANYVGSFTRNDSTNITKTLQKISKDDIRYVGFWLDYNDAYTSLFELRVYTEKIIIEEPFNPSDYDNALSGKIPMAFGTTAKDTLPNALNYHSVTVSGSGLTEATNYVGFLSSWAGHKEQLTPYLALLTDENNNNTFSYKANDANDDIFMTYDLGEEKDIRAIEVLSGAWKNDVDVYVSSTTDGLFSTDNYVASFTRNDSTDVTEQLQKIEKDNIRYVGFWLDYTEATSLFEIRVYTEKTFDSLYENVLTSKIPISFATTKKDTLPAICSCGKVMVGTSGLEDLTTYGYTPSHHCDQATKFINHLSVLTDNNANNNLTIVAEDTSNNDVYLLYDLEDEKDIRAIEIISASYASDVDVYAAATTADLFSEANRVGNFSRNNSAYTNDSLQMISKDNVRYVGFFLDYNAATSFSEFRVYTAKETITESTDTNLIEGKTPVSLYAVTDNTTTDAYRFVKFGSGDSDTPYRFGAANPGTAPQATLEKLNCLTDPYIATSVMLHNEGDSTDIVLVYDLGNKSSVSEIIMSATSDIKDVEFYLGNSYVKLLNSENLIEKYTANGTNATITLDSAKEALYLGVIIRVGNLDGLRVTDIKVMGKEMQKAELSQVDLGKVAPVNPNANDATKALYQYLNGVGQSDRTILGAQINVLASSLEALNNDNNYYDFIAQKYGVTPVVYGTSYYFNYTGNKENDINIYKQYYKEGGVPLILCLSRAGTLNAFDEIRANNEYASNYLIKYLDKTYSPSSSESALATAAKDEFWAEVEETGEFFKQLEEAGVETYMVSPFNELNINGFYGDAASGHDMSAYVIRVWQQVYDYLINDPNGPQLKGALFVYRPSAYSKATHPSSYFVDPFKYYPGDAYVDILAPTIYSLNNDAQLIEIPDYNSFVNTGKVFAISEAGPLHRYTNTQVTDCKDFLTSIKETYPTASFVNLWYGTNLGINHHENAEEFINSNYFIDMDTMVDYRYDTMPTVELYAGNDYTSTVVTAECGLYPTIQIDIDINSIKLNDGFKVTLYANSNGTGASLTFDHDVANVAELDFEFNSIKIEYSTEYVLYDANDDTTINICDLVFMNNLIENPSENLAADVNKDGRIDKLDLIECRKRLLS